MALRNIYTEDKDNETLRKVSREVSEFGGRTNILLDDMRETLIDSGGVGLAAPQLGILRRAVVMFDNDSDEIVELINPVIIERGEEEEGSFEGCLSCPGRRGWVVRPLKVKVRAADRTGRKFEREFTDLAARCACHECDHLDGKLFVDLCDKVYSDEELDELLARMEENDEKQEAKEEK